MNAYVGHPKIAVAAFGLALLLFVVPVWAQHGGHGGGHSGSHGGGGQSSSHTGIGGHSSGHSPAFPSDGSFGSNWHSDGISHGLADSFHTDHHFDPTHHHHLFFHRHHFGGYVYFPFYYGYGTYSPGYDPYVYDSTPALSGFTLLAFFDNSIVAVADYWIENDELH